ncbi:hypothetical protein D6789_01375 [Candidatus Woesearchaeota archaeon]|nr:MAG: hypothetical protein D6789_01375 [Candidatus Woesearchaeota archaeon]
MFEKVLAALAARPSGTLRSPYGTAHPAFTPIERTASTLVFVDGGNAVLYESPEALLAYIRVAAIRYEGRKRTAIERREGALLVLHEGETIRATSEEFGFAETFDANDTSLRMGADDVALATVAQLCRFLIECRVAANRACLVIRDGTLQGLNEHEEKALSQLDNVAGLAKTTTLRSSTGASATSAVLARAPGGAWCCTLDERCALVKLHPRSDYVFRLDSDAPTVVANKLAVLADDPAFLGYPYGLIEADRLARISHQEARLLRLRFQAEAGSAWRALAERERALDAHSILDALANRKRLK